MNRSKLKSYAPAARQQFRRAITDRASKIGLGRVRHEPLEVSGDFAFINGLPFPRAVASQRGAIEKWMDDKGFDGVIEAAAYTWFNRLMAIRYMEVHGYLDHGGGHSFRVLSHPDGKERPQILEEAENVTLPGLDTARVIALKLDGTKDEELYKLLLLAQCRALNEAMPWLFEPIDDATEALLPDNLLASDSIVRQMVTQVEEGDWAQVEIIGWLYQFYISEKKDEVIGKVVKSEDIPAATQLFTPNWIVKYMVQNSLGRQWLATYPQSSLRSQMEFYIEPAQQSDEVQQQLRAITPETLDPEKLTLLDPAVGSGHILVEAYDLFKQIYSERGYRPREFPRLILEKNLFGLDIDDRAAQMAGFALLMKARADDRRLLENPPRLNVRALQNSDGADADEIAEALQLDAMPLRLLCALFRDAKTFGSLLTVPPEVAAQLDAWQTRLDERRAVPDLLTRGAVEALEPLVQQAQMLARRYDAVVANPPYMGGKGMNPALKTFAGKNYANSKSDLFAMFIERCLSLTETNGFCGMVTIQNWMFLSTFETMRVGFLETKTINSLVQIGYNSFPELNSKVAQACTFSIMKVLVPGYGGTYFNLVVAQMGDT